MLAILFALLIMGGGGWWAYQSLSSNVAQVAVVSTEKIREHLRQTVEETYRRELAEAEAAPDWKERERLRQAVEDAHASRLQRIEELAASFVEIEGRGTATSVFQELTRILEEQGVDEAIAYMATQRAGILETVRTRAIVVRERNRKDLEPLLRTAALYDAKGQQTEARALYTEILSVEPDWPEALHETFWFLVGQGDQARERTTLADARRDYEAALRHAQRLTIGDPVNLEWQRNLLASHERIGEVLQAQGDGPGALAAYRQALAISEALTARDPANTDWQRDLSASYGRIGSVLQVQG